MGTGGGDPGGTEPGRPDLRPHAVLRPVSGAGARGSEHCEHDGDAQREASRHDAPACDRWIRTYPGPRAGSTRAGPVAAGPRLTARRPPGETVPTRAAAERHVRRAAKWSLRRRGRETLLGVPIARGGSGSRRPIRRNPLPGDGPWFSSVPACSVYGGRDLSLVMICWSRSQLGRLRAIWKSSLPPSATRVTGSAMWHLSVAEARRAPASCGASRNRIEA
jgi:hypothetical protein